MKKRAAKVTKVKAVANPCPKCGMAMVKTGCMMLMYSCKITGRTPIDHQSRSNYFECKRCKGPTYGVRETT